MKTNSTLLIAILLIASFNTFATVRTVSNNVNSGAQYSNLKAAYNASSNGDTLLVEGSETGYSIYEYYNNNWDKSLVVIGQGLNTAKEGFHKTSINSAGIYWLSFGAGSGGSKFYGIRFPGDGPAFSGASNLVFEDCEFDAEIQGNFSNVTFRNCIFIATGGSNIKLQSAASNLMFSNCIFNNYIYSESGAQTFTVDHCLFLSTGTVFSNVTGVDVRNSIFRNTTNFSGISGSTFSNNMAALSVTFPPAGNTDGGGNLVGQDPMFISYTSGSAYSNTHDYDVQAGSPATNTGSDGTDIGLHGGISGFSESFEVLIAPIMRSMKIFNTSVEAGGTLSIEFHSSKPSED